MIKNPNTSLLKEQREHWEWAMGMETMRVLRTVSGPDEKMVFQPFADTVTKCCIPQKKRYIFTVSDVKSQVLQESCKMNWKLNISNIHHMR